MSGGRWCEVPSATDSPSGPRAATESLGLPYRAPAGGATPWPIGHLDRAAGARPSAAALAVLRYNVRDLR
jgi:hypothetical protein